MYTVSVKQYLPFEMEVTRHYYEEFDARTVAQIEFNQIVRGGAGIYGGYAPPAEEKFVESYAYTAYWGNRCTKVVVSITDSDGKACVLRKFDHGDPT